MDVNDLKGLFAEVNKRMNTAIDHLRHELAGVRTGRASATLLDNVHVDAYGSRMPLNQVAGLSVPEPTLIVAQPFDPSQMAAIEKAIRASDLGLNPAERRQGRSAFRFRRSPRSAARSCRGTSTRCPRRGATACARCGATPTSG